MGDDGHAIPADSGSQVPVAEHPGDAVDLFIRGRGDEGREGGVGVFDRHGRAAMIDAPGGADRLRDGAGECGQRGHLAVRGVEHVHLAQFGGEPREQLRLAPRNAPDEMSGSPNASTEIPAPAQRPHQRDAAPGQLLRVIDQHDAQRSQGPSSAASAPCRMPTASLSRSAASR